MSECSICSETLSTSSRNYRLLQCGHAFHPDCIERWLTEPGRDASCALCRQRVRGYGRTDSYSNIHEESSEEDSNDTEESSSEEETLHIEFSELDARVNIQIEIAAAFMRVQNPTWGRPYLLPGSCECPRCRSNGASSTNQDESFRYTRVVRFHTSGNVEIRRIHFDPGNNNDETETKSLA
eukprot:UN24850